MEAAQTVSGLGPGSVGAGTWASETRTGERSGDGRVGTDSGGRESCATAAGSAPSGSLGHPGDQRPQWGVCGERQDPDRSVFPRVHTRRGQDVACMGARRWSQARSSLPDPRSGHGAPSATRPNNRHGCQMPLLPSHGVGVTELPATTENPRTGHQLPDLHTAYQGANHQQVPGKRRLAPILKTALHLIHQTHTSSPGMTPHVTSPPRPQKTTVSPQLTDWENCK